jgi:hypothetical protein
MNVQNLPHKQQQGYILLVVLAVLVIVTLVGINTAKNSAYHVKFSGVFLNLFHTDILADDGPRCVFTESVNSDTHLEKVYTESAKKFDAAGGDAEMTNAEREGLSGDVKDLEILDEEDANAYSATTNCFAGADNKVAGKPAVVKDNTALCGFTVMEGTDAQFANAVFVSTGFAGKNKTSMDVINSTIWEAGVPNPNKLLDVKENGNEKVWMAGSRAKSFSICRF